VVNGLSWLINAKPQNFEKGGKMIQSSQSSPQELSLVRVFRDRKHELDIVGLANIPTDEATLQLSLRTLDGIVYRARVRMAQFVLSVSAS
jgi:aryl carrier-like protein